MNPLNIRRHYHLMCNGSLLNKNKNRKTVFSNKKEANKVALNEAKNSSETYGLPYKGGVFGNNSLAFYSIGMITIEIVPCDQIGNDHNPTEGKKCHTNLKSKKTAKRV